MSDIIPLKHCPKCEDDFPPTLQYFHADKSKKDGLTCYCKGCQKKPRKNPADLKKHRAASSQFKWCPGCKQDKIPNLDNFHACKSRKDGLAQYCKECKNAQGQKWHSEHKEELKIYMQGYYKENGEEIRAQSLQYYREHVKIYLERRQIYAREHVEETQLYQQEYRQTHKAERRAYNLNREARKKAIPGIHTGQEIREQYARQKGKCYYCGHKVKWGEHHVDHTFPISREGARNSIDHLVIACKPCNLEKHDKYPWEFFKGGRLL